MNLLRRVKNRVRKYIDDCKKTFECLPDPEKTEFDYHMEQVEYEKMLKSLDPRFNYLAPMSPPKDVIKAMSDKEFNNFKWTYIWGEYKNSYYYMLSPSSYARHHAKVVEEYVKQLPTEEKNEQQYLNWENFGHFQKHLNGAYEGLSDARKVQEGKEALETGFVEFLRGYSEGKRIEEDKGPIDPRKMKF